MSIQPTQNSSPPKDKAAFKIEELEAKITGLKKIIDAKNQMLSDLKRDIGILNRVLDDKWIDIDGLTKDLSKAHARNVLLQERVDEAEDITANQLSGLKAASLALIMAADKAAGGKYSSYIYDLAAARNTVADLVGIKKVEVEIEL